LKMKILTWKCWTWNLGYLLFKKKILYSSFIIFIVGYISRFIIFHYYNIDVVYDYTSMESIGFFGFFSLFVAGIKYYFNIIFDNNKLMISTMDSNNPSENSSNNPVENTSSAPASNIPTSAPSESDPIPLTPRHVRLRADGSLDDSRLIINRTTGNNPPHHNPHRPFTTIDDPTEIGPRGYDPNSTSQPLARNIAAALENRRSIDKSMPHLDRNSVNWFTQFLIIHYPRVIYGIPGKPNANAYPNTVEIIKHLRRLP